MAPQCVGLLLLSCLFALTSSAPMTAVTSLELKDDNELTSNTLNLVKPLTLELLHSDDDVATPLSGDVEDRTPLDDDVDVDTPRSYVDASVFRKNDARLADAVKPKPSSFVKKTVSTIDKNVKKGREMKHDVSVPSDKLEPPSFVAVEDFDVVVDDKETNVREIDDTEVESMTSPSVKTDASTVTSETPMTSSWTNEGVELPRLSPPIWLHSSLAEAMSDPLRLPIIEPYDRYDRYSHSIARDSLW